MKHQFDARSHRRRFLYVTTGTAALGFGQWNHLLGGNQETRDGALQPVTRTCRALGTQVSLTALHVDAETATAAIEEAFAELRLVERLMSIYLPNSQLAQLNRERQLRDPHPYLVEVLGAAETMSRRSDGGFDVTVQPLWSLFAEAKKMGALPEAGAIAAARRRIDWRQVEVHSDLIRLRGEAMITLNGIGQGFAADRVEAALRKRGIRHALVNTGELSGLGTKAGREWVVGVQHPRREDAYISLAKLTGRCLATSGDYATSFSEDHRHNHLFDPRTGLSPSELSSVSIAAATATEADALSTAVIVLGAKQGLALVQDTPDADALLVLKDGRIRATEGFPFHA